MEVAPRCGEGRNCLVNSVTEALVRWDGMTREPMFASLNVRR